MTSGSDSEADANNMAPSVEPPLHHSSYDNGFANATDTFQVPALQPGFVAPNLLGPIIASHPNAAMLFFQCPMGHTLSRPIPLAVALDLIALLDTTIVPAMPTAGHPAHNQTPTFITVAQEPVYCDNSHGHFDMQGLVNEQSTASGSGLYHNS